MKMKLTIAAAAVAAALGANAPAFAAIDADGWSGGGGALTGDGGGELFFVAFDASRSETFVLDLNLTANNFINSNASLINSFSVTNSGLQTWISGSSNQNNIVWNLGGLSNDSTTFGFLTTHGSAGSTIDGAEIPPSGFGGAMEVGMDNGEGFIAGVNATIDDGFGGPDATLGTGNGSWGGGLWAGTYGGALTGFDNSETGFADQMLMSFIYADPSNFEGQPLVQTFSNGFWDIDAGTGTVSYVGASVVPVPAAVWLFGSGLLGLAGVARRRRS